MAIFEEPLAEESITSIFTLGPGYIGCFQSPCIGDIFEVWYRFFSYFICESFIME